MPARARHNCRHKRVSVDDQARGLRMCSRLAELYGGRVWQVESECPFGRFEFVVDRKIGDEFPGQGLQLAQAKINNNAFDAIDDIGHNVRRVGDMVARAGISSGAKLRHHPRKSFGPVAWTKALAFFGHPVDN